MAQTYVRSVVLASLMSCVAYFLLGFTVGHFLLREPGGSMRAPLIFGGFMALLGGLSTYHRRRWPHRSQWYELAVAGVAVAATLMVWFVVKQML